MCDERTLVLLKPDATKRNAVGAILTYFERAGLKVARMRSVKYPSRFLCELHYREHVEKPFFGRNVEFLHSGLVIAVIIEGENAIARVREIIGATSPADAAPGTIRGDFGGDLPCNLVHGSDSLEATRLEIPLWFS